jgi:hypothetical protein
MKFRVQIGIIVLAASFILASAYIASAGEGQQAPDVRPAVVSVSWWSKSDSPTYTKTRAMRVDRDLEANHEDDINRIGDDEAYNSAEHRNREADFRENHWSPNSYGLMGNYSRDEH